MKAIMARFIYPRGSFYEMLNEGDKEIEKALEILNNKKLYDDILSSPDTIF
jgi:hypothetical protein